MQIPPKQEKHFGDRRYWPSVLWVPFLGFPLANYLEEMSYWLQKSNDGGLHNQTIRVPPCQAPRERACLLNQRAQRAPESRAHV